MNLSDVFSAVAYKRLVPVDLPGGSHQHELNGNTVLRRFFGDADIRGKVSWFYFADDQDALSDDGFYRFYDARAKSAERTGRTEYRMYYEGEFPAAFGDGDVLFLARPRVPEQENEIYGMAFQQGSNLLRAASLLFDVQDAAVRFELLSDETLSAQTLEFAQQRILEELGIEVPVPERPSDETLITDKFGLKFPTTREMSAFARTQVETDLSDPDETLVRWLHREEELFRALERIIVQERLDHGFSTVDDFIAFSLSVHNTRKSRMGHAFENHLAALFDANALRYKHGGVTEGKNRPDFLFPGESEYKTPSFDATLLVMLAAKSTCKDRWRQVLTEAARIPQKHLCTLEPSISVAQTDEMREQHVVLVLPSRLFATYTPGQVQGFMDVQGFIEYVGRKQAGLPPATVNPDKRSGPRRDNGQSSLL